MPISGFFLIQLEQQICFLWYKLEIQAPDRSFWNKLAKRSHSIVLRGCRRPRSRQSVGEFGSRTRQTRIPTKSLIEMFSTRAKFQYFIMIINFEFEGTECWPSFTSDVLRIHTQALTGTDNRLAGSLLRMYVIRRRMHKHVWLGQTRVWSKGGRLDWPVRQKGANWHTIRKTGCAVAPQCASNRLVIHLITSTQVAVQDCSSDGV